MNRYSDHTDTGIEWIGDIPSNWNIKPLFALLQENKTKNIFKNENVLTLSYGQIKLRDLSKNRGLLPENFEGYQVVENGYIIIRSTDLQNDKKSLRVGLVRNTGVITSAYLGLIPSKEISPDFTYQYLNMCDLKKVFYGLGGGLRQSLRFDDFKRFPLLVPPPHEQTLISKYLNKKTSQIDSLIEKIERKIKLLKEQRTSLINQCVTKGLNPDVEMKDSGIEWMGEIPRHWKVKRLKYFSSVELSSVDRHIVEDEIPVDVCHYTQVYKNEKINKTTELSKGTCTPQELKKFSLFKGDILLTKDSESPDDIGIPTLIEEELKDTVCGYHLCHIRVLKKEMNPEFLYRFIESTMIQKYFSISSNGVTRFGLGKPIIENMPVLLPPPVDQQTIADKINRFSTLVLSTISKETNRIELLKEYRQSLISNVVTGKIRITEKMI